MPSRERSYRTTAGQELRLRSERGILRDGSGWWLKLQLFAPGPLGIVRRRVSFRELKKDGSWSTSAIELLQAQEELELLRGASVELELLDLLLSPGSLGSSKGIVSCEQPSPAEEPFGTE